MKYNNISKVCSLYVDNWHLTTMLLPYVNKTVKKNEKVLTILEVGIKDKVEELLSKMNLKPETQNKILEINWTSNELCKYSKIVEQIKTLANEIQTINIITTGTQSYKNNANRNIQKLLKEITNKKVTIIDCYDVTKYKEIDKILEKYEFVLNTSGIKKKEEIFPSCKKEDKLG